MYNLFLCKKVTYFYIQGTVQTVITEVLHCDQERDLMYVRDLVVHFIKLNLYFFASVK